MTNRDLRHWIENMTQDISFTYKGVEGSICPFSETDIAISYGDEAQSFHSVDDAMRQPFIDGKPMEEICGDMQFD